MAEGTELLTLRTRLLLPASQTSLYAKVQPNGEALATKVKLGRASVNTIEVIEGLTPGDQVILSDMSAYDNYDRIKLN